jgi:hypothetical protein
MFCRINRREGWPRVVTQRWYDEGIFYLAGRRFVVEQVLPRGDVQVSEFGGRPAARLWTECFNPPDGLQFAAIMGERKMALKWIKRALDKKPSKKASAMVMDPALGKDRPALTEFMTETTGPDDKPRDVSALMVVCTEAGVRAGLKDEDAGGWCWREGTTLAEALDSIEKALQVGEGAFRGPRTNVGRKRR